MGRDSDADGFLVVLIVAVLCAVWGILQWLHDHWLPILITGAIVGGLVAIVNVPMFRVDRRVPHRRPEPDGHRPSPISDIPVPTGVEDEDRRTETAGDAPSIETEATFIRGQELDNEGDETGAERSYREAAECGHRAASYMIGVLCMRRSDSSASEMWLRRATDELDASLARELGRSLRWDAEVVEKEYELRCAVQAGDPVAGYELAGLLQRRGADDDAVFALQWVMQKTVDLSAELLGARAWTPGAIGPDDELGARIMARARLGSLVLMCHLHRGAEDPVYAEPFVDRWLTQRAQVGDLEATFLLSGLTRYRGFGGLPARDVNEPLLRTAAERGHGESAYALAIMRAVKRDTGGSIFWYRRAAEAGYQPGALEYATRVQFQNAELAARFAQVAARVGHPGGMALLRVLTKRVRPPRRGTSKAKQREPDPSAEASSTTTRTDSAIPKHGRPPRSRPRTRSDAMDAQITKLLAIWDLLRRVAPDPQRCLTFLATQGRMPEAQVAQLRRIRNRCAHPAEHGLPDREEIKIALATAKELSDRLRRSGHRIHNEIGEDSAG